jgi:glucose/arabinose dehydrogenase
MQEGRGLSARAGQLCTIGAAVGCLVLGASGAWSQGTVPIGFSDQQMVPGLDNPSGMAFMPDGRLLVLEQFSGVVQLVNFGTPNTVTPIFTVPQVISGGEQGLLGIAIDRGWPTRNYVYLYYDHSGDSKIRITRYLVTGDLDDTAGGDLAISATSAYHLIVDIPDNADNHNGGTLRFGPDGMLYASIGEDATPCAAQDSVTLRGVILRLDVSRLPNTPGGPAPKGLIAAPGNPFAAHPDSNARLVWALGLRNPFRFHIDAPTGDLFIADVGQSRWEEVDIASSGGRNFGWPHFEGPATYTANTCSDLNSGFTQPIHAYDRTGSPAAIISAGLYRRPASGSDRFPSFYDGDYFFNDYYQGFLRRLTGSGSAWTIAPVAAGQPSAMNWGTGFKHVSDWAVGPSGALWYCRQSDDLYSAGTGEIRRLVYAPGSAPSIASVEATAGLDGTTATIRWLTDVLADSRVDYGEDPGMLDRAVGLTDQILNHVVSLGGLEAETVYYYRVSSAGTTGGTTVYPDPVSPPNQFLTFPLPGSTQLLAPFPSPAVGGATLPFDLYGSATVTLRLYDMRGRLVRTLIGGASRPGGANAETWDGLDDDGRAVSAGVYVVRLGVGGEHFERRFALIR